MLARQLGTNLELEQFFALVCLFLCGLLVRSFFVGLSYVAEHLHVLLHRGYVRDLVLKHMFKLGLYGLGLSLHGLTQLPV